jgi:hypothetical protein
LISFKDDDETWGDHASQEPSGGRRYSRSIGEEEETELERKIKLDEIEMVSHVL